MTVVNWATVVPACAALERDCEYFRLNPLVEQMRRRLSGPLANALLANDEIQQQLARVITNFDLKERNDGTA
jgi:hypothetical protein